MNRQVLNPELAEREVIQVVVVFCDTAKAAGRQYTKRLFPDWVIPHSPIRLDALLRAEQAHRERRASLEQCCQIIGCQEPRTVAKHLKRLTQAAMDAALQTAREIAHAPQLSSLPPVNPELAPVPRLQQYYQFLIRVWAGAGTPHGAPEVRKLIQTELWKLFGKLSITCTVPAGHPP